ncbi:hypothetical protein CFH90_12035 [Acinetobacter johnsonii]|uniref:Type I restriction modification DNA specificity domain-containing protein n=1 Tax=Acinetobacter johnsonii TaxID=40214 RepID=A0A3Q8XG82_ACIJO|nr:restriction endonuclease subunit S [Acinetobacter johnsonii]AZN64724.1 hypothetical protein CFH90_12035 [Acinetobacter johnsonii]
MSVPKLRFKEFDEAWKPSILADISNIVTGSTPATSKSEYYDGDFLFVSPADIQENRYVDATKTTLTKEGFNKCRHIPKNSILFVCIGSTIGKIAQNKEICATNQQINAVIPNNDHVSDFLYLVLDKLAPSIKLTAGVQAVPLINKTEFGKTELFTPTLGEQTKIASFLSAVDEKISQLTQKHELLSQYKQGMMQKLFSQHIRFKADDGSEFAKWEDSKLGELTILITKGTTPSSLGEKYEESGINFIKIESLSSNGKFLLDKFAYIDENTHNKLARSKLEHDDILFSIAGALGRVAIISRDYLPANTNQALAIIRLKDKKITRYIYYFLNSDYVKKIIDSESVQLAQANFSLGQLANLDVLVPCLEEQTKIANFLSAIDQKIEVVAQQIEQAKTWKKGLLQQMFV